MRVLSICAFLSQLDMKILKKQNPAEELKGERTAQLAFWIRAFFRR